MTVYLAWRTHFPTKLFYIFIPFLVALASAEDHKVIEKQNLLDSYSRSLSVSPAEIWGIEAMKGNIPTLGRDFINQRK